MKIYLDLLPAQRKQEIRRKKRFASILREEVLFILPVIVFIFILLSVNYLLTLERDSSSVTNMVKQSQDKYQKFAVYEEKFKQTNELDQKLLKIESAHFHWIKLFFALSKAIPDDVYVSNLSTKDYAVHLVGKARLRENLLSFKGNLESTGCFKEVNIPLSDLVNKNDIEFQIELIVKEDCLKNKK